MSRCFSAVVSAACFSSPATLSSTACSMSVFSLSTALAAASFAFISATRAFLGSTSLATREKMSTACTQMASVFAAEDTRPTAEGSMAGSLMYFCSLRRRSGGTFSESYVSRSCMKVERPSTTFAVSQSMVSPSSRHTASITITTTGGGLGKDFTSLMSFLSSFASASSAALSAGSATSRSFCASSEMAFTSAACTATSAASFSTRTLITSASALSLVTRTSSSPASMVLRSMKGCILVSSACRPSTMVLVSSSLREPTARVLRRSSSALRRSPSMDRYRLMRSR